jgi:hypothetical protein
MKGPGMTTIPEQTLKRLVDQQGLSWLIETVNNICLAKVVEEMFGPIPNPLAQFDEGIDSTNAPLAFHSWCDISDALCQLFLSLRYDIAYVSPSAQDERSL